MKELSEKRWARVLAAVLFILFLLLSTAAAVIVRYGRMDNWYRMNSTDTFAVTSSGHSFVEQGNYFVEQNVRWLEDMTLDHLGSYAGAAYAYVIIDGDGNTTVDTRTENSVFVADNGFVPVPEPGFTVRGYINLPVNPYDGCYAEYATFQMFFRYRFVLLALKIAALLLACVCVLVLCLGATRRGREGRLNKALSLPFDAVLLAGVILFSCRGYVSSWIANGIMYLFTEYARGNPYHLYYPFYYSIMYMVDIVIAAALLWYMSGQVGGRVLTKNVITIRLLKRVPQPVFILLLLVVHLALLYFAVGGNTFYNIDYIYMGGARRIMIIILAAIDVIAAAVLILYQREEKRISDAARELSSGNLAYKTDVKKLHFVWRSLGQALNSIGDGMAQAVEDQMRSERMKTELITNVSHDLKTPLTSIINYIDFLKADGLDEATRTEYLGILDRQSGRLKKLTEDVVEASKAASGALSVEAEPIDMRELMDQFLGEYGDRMKAARIEPVLTAPEGAVTVMADSVLLGRVIDNLMANIVKYAQPETRAYFDLAAANGVVSLSAKNVSKAPLNISAEELMERFVRGDSSRHTEGSGLGLSIARSLTELMGGTLELVLDGDLFKAIVCFAAADEK